MTDQKKRKFKAAGKKNNYKGKKKSVGNMAKQKRAYIAPTEIRAGGTFEYKMPPGVIADLKRTFKNTNIDQRFLVNYVNEEYGLLGTCVRVIVG